VGGYLVNLGSGYPLGGWYAYSPLTSAVYAPARGLHGWGWLRVIIWLVLIGLWALASIRVLRPSSEKVLKQEQSTSALA
jgi:hypothetical protein